MNTPKITEPPSPSVKLRNLREAFKRRAEKIASRVWLYIRENKNSLDSQIHTNKIAGHLREVFSEVEELASSAIHERDEVLKAMTQVKSKARAEAKTAKEKIEDLEKQNRETSEDLIRKVARIEFLETRPKPKPEKPKKPIERPRKFPKKSTDKQGEAVTGVIAEDTPLAKEIKVYKDKAKKLAAVASSEEVKIGG